MSVSSEKSSAQLFTRLRGKSIEIKIHNSKLSCNRVQRLLGVQFDAPNLTYGPHLQLMSENIRKRIDIMKCLASTSWGASQKVLHC